MMLRPILVLSLLAGACDAFFMVLEATYFVPYKRGLLKEIHRSLVRNQYYSVRSPDLSLRRIETKPVRTDKTVDYDPEKNSELARVDLGIFRGDHILSNLIFLPALGELRVSDGLLLDPRDVHRKACNYYAKLASQVSGNSMVDEAKIRVHLTGSDMYANTYGEKLNSDQALAEIPGHLRTKEENRIVTCVFGAEGPCKEETIEDALSRSDEAFVRTWLSTDPVGYSRDELITLACRAKAANCLDAILESDSSRPPPSEALKVALNNHDLHCIFTLLKYGSEPTDLDIYRSANRGDKDIFQLLMQKVRSEAFDRLIDVLE